MIAAWLLLGLVAAFLALKAWADAGDAIAEEAATTGDGEQPIPDGPGMRLAVIAVGLVAGLLGLGAWGLIDRAFPDEPASRGPCIARLAPSATPSDPAAAEAVAALMRRLEPDLCP